MRGATDEGILTLRNGLSEAFRQSDGLQATTLGERCDPGTEILRRSLDRIVLEGDELGISRECVENGLILSESVTIPVLGVQVPCDGLVAQLSKDFQDGVVDGAVRWSEPLGFNPENLFECNFVLLDFSNNLSLIERCKVRVIPSVGGNLVTRVEGPVKVERQRISSATRRRHVKEDYFLTTSE